jgi:hypothetical protein
MHQHHLTLANALKKAAVIAAFFISLKFHRTWQHLVGRHLISRNNHGTATLDDGINTTV